MSKDGGDLPVADDELLARYTLFKKWVRPDLTVSQDAFVPPSDFQLSVTRHLDLTEEDIWQLGNDVSKLRKRPLFGRADIVTSDVRKHTLEVKAAPIIPSNKNHAHVVGWPSEKSARKIIAQELAAVSRFVPNPDFP